MGNAVFTEFQGELGKHTELDQKVIDMGAGLERFAWITMGTPTAYDCCFGPITNHLIQKVGIDADSTLLTEYFTAVAKNIENYDDIFVARKHSIQDAGLTDEQVNRIISPLEGIYLIADHIRTLIFAISDGALPSNVGGGYNLRMVLRRIIGTMERLKLKLDVNEMIDMQIDYLKDTYPELEETREEVKTIVSLESERYQNSKSRMQKIVSKIKNPSVDDLITLYESDGITPDYLKEMNVISEIPSVFYSKLSDLHQSAKKEHQVQLPLEGLPETEMLFYADDPKTFSAKVLKAFDKYVVLDKTSFYARGGGQEPDHGTIAEFDVVDVTKHGNVIVHELKGGIPQTGQVVSCIVDANRRKGITKHHTSTHILNSSSRSVLGSWVWQHSAFKEVDHARLDITHHSALTDDEVARIEKVANSIVAENLPVTIQNYDRGTAEQKYGFRIYQGGVVPVKQVRIVSIEDFDVEACGGTHVKSTKQVELIKITRTKRIQDGVVRLEFVAGESAKQYVQDHAAELQKKEEEQAAKEQREKLRTESKEKAREKIPAILEQILKTNNGTIENIIVSSGRFYSSISDEYDEFFHINFGEKLVSQNPKAVYCGIFEEKGTIRAIIHAGDEAAKQKKAGDIAKAVSEVLGGSGGGNPKFAQGGGKDKSKKEQAINKAKSMVLG